MVDIVVVNIPRRAATPAAGGNSHIHPLDMTAVRGLLQTCRREVDQCVVRRAADRQVSPPRIVHVPCYVFQGHAMLRYAMSCDYMYSTAKRLENTFREMGATTRTGKLLKGDVMQLDPRSVHQHAQFSRQDFLPLLVKVCMNTWIFVYVSQSSLHSIPSIQVTTLYHFPSH